MSCQCLVLWRPSRAYSVVAFQTAAACRDNSFLLKLQSIRTGWKVVLIIIGLVLAKLTYDFSRDRIERAKQLARERRERKERERLRREEEAKANAPKIKFTVREMTGKEDPVETLGALHTIAELRQAVAQLTGKGADTFNLTLQGHLLKDGEGTLGSHGIEEGVVVVMTPGSQPGPQPDVDEGVPEDNAMYRP